MRAMTGRAVLSAERAALFAAQRWYPEVGATQRRVESRLQQRMKRGERTGGRTAMDLTPFLRDWPFLRGGQSQPLMLGTNNRMWRVTTASGAYALRLADAQLSPSRISFEYNILSQLRAAGLPFALPVPLLSAQGAPYARIQTVEGASLAVLTPFIPGAHPRRDDLAQTESAGAALAQLDEALARIAPMPPDEALTWRATGDLAHCHPYAPDPRAAIAALPLPNEALAQLVGDYEALLPQREPLYASLPRQLSHEDFDPSNVLMEGALLRGVLDWEFCALDLRPMDLVIALAWWPVERLGTGDEWPIIAALLR